MLNVIAEGLDKNATSAQNAAQSRNGATFDVQSGADDTGLPMLVVRAPFNQVWQRLPARWKKWA
jgi:outer membrane protein assembly factor BamC